MSDIIIGIDLGTTNSMAAKVYSDGAAVIEGDGGTTFIPSVVCYAGNETLTGKEAIDAADKHPESTFFSFKRFMGRGRKDIANDLVHLVNQLDPEAGDLIKFKAGERSISPEELSAEILKAIKVKSEKILGETVSKAVITVPAYFDDGQRQATRNAALLAGLEPVRIINEPTAAAVAYGLDQKNKGKIMVYDLGGGTFDVSVLDLKGKIFRVLATNGDTHLGGDDIDRLIAADVNRRFAEKHGNGFSETAWSKHFLKIIAEKIKITLSTSNVCRMQITDPADGRVLDYQLKVDELEAIVEPLFLRTLRHIEQALADAGLQKDEIKDVVMVGGSTRLPYIRKRVAEYFGRAPHVRINPDEVVAIGASIQAHLLMGKRRDFLLMDVIPLSLGLETVGGTFSKLILKNSPIPAKADEVYSTSVDKQTGIDINVYQGEREMVKDCRLLGRIKLSGIPPMPAGYPRLAVSFAIDHNGILSVSAVEERSGASATIDIVPEYGLSPQKIRQMVEDSIDNAIEDFGTRHIAEFKTKASMMLNGFDKIRTQAEELMPPEAFKNILTLRADLEKSLQSEDPSALKNAMDSFGASTGELADLIISRSITQELTKS